MGRRVKKAAFKFRPFSRKQKKILTWWMPNSPVHDMDGIIADGAIRSGKTVSMSLSFAMWAMESFDGQNFAMCGKTIGSFRRNVLFWLKLMLKSRGYYVEDHRADNLVIVRRNGMPAASGQGSAFPYPPPGRQAAPSPVFASATPA